MNNNLFFAFGLTLILKVILKNVTGLILLFPGM
jgi:hypothetical protein